MSGSLTGNLLSNVSSAAKASAADSPDYRNIERIKVFNLVVAFMGGSPEFRQVSYFRCLLIEIGLNVVVNAGFSN